MYPNLWPDELKILVIDDEQDFLNIIRLSLEPAGFRVLRTNKPEEGLALALREDPDLLILDLTMPTLDGIELLRRVRRDPRMGKVPVIIVSARINNLNQRRIDQLLGHPATSIDACLGKPFEPGHLLKTVKEVLLNHRDELFQKKKFGGKPWSQQEVV
jgi:DNA-binding response OmpR family regulator